jgi:hypothetical protein
LGTMQGDAGGFRAPSGVLRPTSTGPLFRQSTR